MEILSNPGSAAAEAAFPLNFTDSPPLLTPSSPPGDIFVLEDNNARIPQSVTPLSAQLFSTRPEGLSSTETQGPKKDATLGAVALAESAAHMAGGPVGYASAIGLYFESIADSWETAYQEAPKRNYYQHGLKFRYAAVTRDKMPSMLIEGSAGLCFGDKLFVMTDFLPSVGSDDHKMLDEMMAVHEYGENFFADYSTEHPSHYFATLLELAIAHEKGILEKYLIFLQNYYPVKFRDVIVRYLYSQKHPEALKNLASWSRTKRSASVNAAIDLIQRFVWPKDLVARLSKEFLKQHPTSSYEEIDHANELDPMKQWAQQTTAHDQIRQHVLVAAQKLAATGRAAPAAHTLFYGSLRGLYQELDTGTLTPTDDLDALHSIFERAVRDADVLYGSNWSGQLLALPHSGSSVVGTSTSLTWEETMAILKAQEDELNNAHSDSLISDIDKPERFLANLWKQADLAMSSYGLSSWSVAIQRVGEIRVLRKELLSDFQRQKWAELMQPALEAPTSAAAIVYINALIKWEVLQAVGRKTLNGVKSVVVPLYVAQDFAAEALEYIKRHPLISDLNIKKKSLLVELQSADLENEISYLVRENSPKTIYRNYWLELAKRPRTAGVTAEVVATQIAKLWLAERIFSDATDTAMNFEATVLEAVSGGKLSREMAQKVLIAGWRIAAPGVDLFSTDLVNAAAEVHGLNEDQKESLASYRWLHSPSVQRYRDNELLGQAYLSFLKETKSPYASVLSATDDDVMSSFAGRGDFTVIYESLGQFQETRQASIRYQNFYLQNLARHQPAKFVEYLSSQTEEALLRLYRSVTYEISYRLGSLSHEPSSWQLEDLKTIGQGVNNNSLVVSVAQATIRLLGVTPEEETNAQIEGMINTLLRRWTSSSEGATALAGSAIARLIAPSAAPRAYSLTQRMIPQTMEDGENRWSWQRRITDQLYDNVVENWLLPQENDFASYGKEAVPVDDTRMILGHVALKKILARLYQPIKGDLLSGYIFDTLEKTSEGDRVSYIKELSRTVLRAGIEKLDAFMAYFQLHSEEYRIGRRELGAGITRELSAIPAEEMFTLAEQAIRNGHSIETVLEQYEFSEDHLTNLAETIDQQCKTHDQRFNRKNWNAVSPRLSSAAQNRHANTGSYLLRR